jgi:hypothetical protein
VAKEKIMRALTRIQWLFLPCLIALALSGCEAADDDPSPTNKATMIRIHNVSAHDFENIIAGDHFYGAVDSAAFSEYADLGVAYHYNYVELTADGADFVIQPIDYVGETPLGPGYFTYEIDITDFDARLLNISAMEDESP